MVIYLLLAYAIIELWTKRSENIPIKTIVRGTMGRVDNLAGYDEKTGLVNGVFWERRSNLYCMFIYTAIF